jgi:hypothetical protein
MRIEDMRVGDSFRCGQFVYPITRIEVRLFGRLEVCLRTSSAAAADCWWPQRSVDLALADSTYTFHRAYPETVRVPDGV